MLEHPRVSVLGTSVATFSGATIRANGKHTRVQEHQPARSPPDTAVHLPVSAVQRIARHPTDPALLAWSMLFSCCLAHPSVVLRRDRVLDVGGYDPTTEPAEDYDLWLRMQSSAIGCVANLGEVRCRNVRCCCHESISQYVLRVERARYRSETRVCRRLVPVFGVGQLVRTRSLVRSAIFLCTVYYVACWKSGRHMSRKGGTQHFQFPVRNATKIGRTPASHCSCSN